MPTSWYRKEAERACLSHPAAQPPRKGATGDGSPRTTPPPEDSTTTAILLTGPERAERGQRDRKPIGGAAPERWRREPIYFMGLRFNKIYCRFVESAASVGRRALSHFLYK